MVTHVPVPTVAPAAPATTAGFAAAHGGDGAGFYTIGFGCDGSAFNMDAWQIGGPAGTIRYDLEGLATTTDIAGSQQQVAPGEPVRLTGKLRLGRGDRMRAGTLMLESRPAAGGEFEVVEVVDAAASDPDVVVRPTESTVYRWRFAGRPMTEASQSALFVVTVLEPARRAARAAGDPGPRHRRDARRRRPLSRPPPRPRRQPPAPSPAPQTEPPSDPPTSDAHRRAHRRARRHAHATEPGGQPSSEPSPSKSTESPGPARHPRS